MSIHIFKEDIGKLDRDFSKLAIYDVCGIISYSVS